MKMLDDLENSLTHLIGGFMMEEEKDSNDNIDMSKMVDKKQHIDDGEYDTTIKNKKSV
jgi:hypothetical protein